MGSGSDALECLTSRGIKQGKEEGKKGNKKEKLMKY